MINGFICVEDHNHVQPDSKTTVASTHTDPNDPDRLCYEVAVDEEGDAVVNEVPWELLPDQDEDQDVTDLRAEFARKQRKFLINIIGTAAFVGGAGIGVSLGDWGFAVVILMMIGYFCMDRK